MIVVSDTTPLNYLILIDAAQVLPALFGRVCAPTAVMRELSDRRGPQPVRAWASSPPDWLVVQEPTQIDQTLPKALHKGELEAISLAQELGADWILIDERKASRAAENCGLRVAGTLGILEEGGARNLIDYEKARDRLVKETSFYVTDDVLHESERRYHDRKLAQEQGRKAQGSTVPLAEDNEKKEEHAE
jgi:predicted nucleic acid-binding protein